MNAWTIYTVDGHRMIGTVLTFSAAMNIVRVLGTNGIPCTVENVQHEEEHAHD